MRVFRRCGARARLAALIVPVLMVSANGQAAPMAAQRQQPPTPPAALDAARRNPARRRRRRRRRSVRAIPDTRPAQPAPGTAQPTTPRRPRVSRPPACRRPAPGRRPGAGAWPAVDRLAGAGLAAVGRAAGHRAADLRSGRQAVARRHGDARARIQPGRPGSAHQPAPAGPRGPGRAGGVDPEPDQRHAVQRRHGRPAGLPVPATRQHRTRTFTHELGHPAVAALVRHRLQRRLAERSAHDARGQPDVQSDAQLDDDVQRDAAAAP